MFFKFLTKWSHNGSGTEYPFDSMAHKLFMNPTVFQNYQDVYMTQLLSSTFRPYEIHYITFFY